MFINEGTSLPTSISSNLDKTSIVASGRFFKKTEAYLNIT
jgi:hypothetical protein